MSDHRHIASHHFTRTLDGTQSPGVLGRLLVTGLHTGCDECRRTWDALSGEQRKLLAAVSDLPDPRTADKETPQPPSSYSDYLDALTAEVERGRGDRKRHVRELWDLKQFPRDQRREKVLSARRRFASAGLADLLLEESRKLVRTDPVEAENLASLVAPVLARNDAPKTPAEVGELAVLAARAEAHRANALRIAGDLPAADEAFAHLTAELAVRPLRDAAAEAEVLSLEASLRYGQRALSHAEELLDAALLLFRQAGDRTGEARALIKRAMTFYDLERPDEALAALDTAAEVIKPADDVYLFISTVTARVVLLCDLDRPAEADELLRAHLDPFEELDDEAAGATLRGLQGRVALGLGRLAAAEEAFASARKAFQVLGRDYDALLAALDLACAYLEAGRAGDLRRLAAELVPTFRARCIGREAMGALALFAKAVAADTLTRDLLDRLRRRIEATRAAPPPV